MKFNDRLGDAKISHEIEKYESRVAAIEDLRQELDSQNILDLAEYFFELSEVPPEGWLAKKFIEHDPTFSVRANAREIRILSAQLLDNELERGNALAGLVVISGYAMNMRSTEDESALYGIAVKLVSEISSRMRNTTVEERQESPSAAVVSKKLTEAISNYESNDDSVLGDLMTQVYKSGLQPNPSLKKQAVAIDALASGLKYAKEESSILWWHISEWCNTTNAPHSKLKSETAALFLPFDAAELVKTSPSPNAFPALFKRALDQRTAKQKAKKKVKLAEFIESAGNPGLENIRIEDYYTDSPGLFPLLFAIKTAKELGCEGNWREVFEKETRLDPNAEVTPHAFAMQLLRELDAETLV